MITAQQQTFQNISKSQIRQEPSDKTWTNKYKQYKNENDASIENSNYIKNETIKLGKIRKKTPYKNNMVLNKHKIGQ